MGSSIFTGEIQLTNSKIMWRIIISGECSPYINMGIDYALWKAVKDKKSSPVLRFYLWNPPSVSLGYGQQADALVHMDFCKKNNIPVVQRPTGGSAIFHDKELTYSFCGHTDSYKDFYSPFSSYISICNALKSGIEKLGIDMKIRGFSEGKEPSMTKIPCFFLSSKYDLVIDNKKVIGSAQKRDKESFLQHGSILMEVRKNLWSGIFKDSRDKDFDKIAGIYDFVKRTIPIENLIENIIGGFKEIFDREFFINILTDEEEKNSHIFASTLFNNLL
ncbi:MAG: lipoate--protein ligase family protein [Candidatus Omnitrophica bacterium]|jgi:lipoate-protein ligase A|nr:lipoate--protein ligase family protein [Candidatus Omnitrophota bacterium]